MLIFLRMIFASMSEILLCAAAIIEVIIFGMGLYIPHTFSNTKAKKIPGLTWLVLVLSKRQLTNGTIAIHLLKLKPFIFLSVIMLIYSATY